MSEICETCAAPIEGGTPFSRYCDTHLEIPDNKPGHLSAEYWSACLGVRDYLLETLEGLVLGVGLAEPNDELDVIMFFIAPNNAGGGTILHNFETGVFIVSENGLLNLSKLIVHIGVYGVPAPEVSALLRGAVELLDIIE